MFDAGDCVVVEHDAETHQLRVVGSTTFDRASRSSGTEHYEVLLRTRPTPDGSGGRALMESGMNCPKCQSAMATVKIGIVEVDRCTSCGGLWFDSLEEEWLKTPGDAVALDVGDAEDGAR